jgi:hypothetical protein
VLEADVKRSLKRSKRKADEAAVRSMAEETPIECVGGKIDGLSVPSVSAISDKLAAYAVTAGLMPSKGNRNKSASADKFRASLAFVSKCLDEVLSDDGESGFAPSDDIETEMRGLAEKLAAYFAN